jgi:hypothetical protein
MDGSGNGLLRKAQCVCFYTRIDTRNNMTRSAMKLIFLYGLPATGKLTVATELAALTSYRLFHNHLTVDLLLSVFDFGSEPFVELRESIWLSIIEQASHAQLPGLIFTFAPERTVRPQFIPNLLNIVANTNTEVRFIELTCPLNELIPRLDTPSRRNYQKLTSLSLFEELRSAGCFDPFPMPQPELSIDTSRCTPREAATQITQALQLPAHDN